MAAMDMDTDMDMAWGTEIAVIITAGPEVAVTCATITKTGE
jgi:hypothetical protein